MTEDEAKTKWCPFARVRDISFDYHEILDASEDLDLEEGHSRIVGPFSGPAANRFNFDKEGGARGERDLKLASGSLCIASACMAWRWSTVPYANEPKGGRGYCGLAGRS